MKKLIAITLCAVIALSFAACSNEKPAKDNQQKQIAGDSVQIPNPFVDCKTIEDAEKIAGFTVTVPEKMPKGYVRTLIQASQNDMVKIFFENGEKRIEIRKAKGGSDISGDYTEYKEKNSLSVGNLNVSTRGDDNKINVATWTDGEYSYSITANIGETGLDTSTISNMIVGIR